MAWTRAVPLAGQRASICPDARMCCAKMSRSVVSSRRSCHATIAPPAPSETMEGETCPPAAFARAAGSFSSARPSSGQRTSRSPEASTCIANTLTRGRRKSCQVMMAPPAPSGAMAGCSWVVRAVTMARPSDGQVARAEWGRNTDSASAATATGSGCIRMARLLRAAEGPGSVAGGGVYREGGDVHPAHVAARLDVGGRGRERESVARADLHHQRIRSGGVHLHRTGHTHGAVRNAVIAGRAGVGERELHRLTDPKRSEIEGGPAATASTTTTATPVGIGGRGAVTGGTHDGYDHQGDGEDPASAKRILTLHDVHSCRPRHSLGRRLRAAGAPAGPTGRREHCADRPHPADRVG